MSFDPNIHHRRSIRLKGYDYAQAGLYFVTICVQNRANIFGHISNGEMKLSYLGKIAAEEWLNTLAIRDNIALAEYIVMPNHIHGIIEIKFAKIKTESIGAFKSPSQTIGAIIRGYKGATTKKIKEIIRNNKDFLIGKSNSDSFSDSSKDFDFRDFDSSNKIDSRDIDSPPNIGSSPNFDSPPNFDSSPNLDFPPSTGELQFAPTELSKIDLSKSIWQRDYYENIIRDEKAYLNISNYIINNPKKWEADKFFKKNTP